MLAQRIQQEKDREAAAQRYHVWVRLGPTKAPELIELATTRNEAQGILDNYRRSHRTADAWITEKPLAATRS